MDQEGIVLSEISHVERENTVLFHLYVKYKKKQMNKHNRNRIYHQATQDGDSLALC